MEYSPQDFESLLARKGRAAEEKRAKGTKSSAAEYETLKKRNKAKPILSKANEIGGLVGDVLRGKEEEVQQEVYNKYLEVKPQRIENINNAFFSDMGNLSAPSKSPIPLFETAESVVKNRTGRLNYDKWYQDKYGETKEEHGLPDMALEGIYWREAQDAYYGSLFGAETIDAIKGSLRKAYPNIDTEGVDIDGERYSIDEMTEAAYPHVVGTVHSLMMDASDEYRKYNFWKSTGKSYRSYMEDSLSEIEKEIKALQKEAGDAAYADTKAREMERLMSGSGDIVVPHWSAIGAEKVAEARYEDALDHIASMRENDFASGFADAVSLKSALSLGISDVLGGIETNTILKKMQNGEELYGEEKRIARLLQLEAQAQNIAKEIYGAPSWTNKLGSFVGGTVEMLPQFLTGNALMGGVGKTAQVVTKEGINQAVRGGLKSTLKYAGGAGKRMLSNIPTHLMRGYAAAPAMPMTYADFLEQRNSQYQVNPDGSVTFTPKSAAKAYLSSINNTAAEFASEGFGGDLGEVLGLGAKGAGKMLGIDKLTTRNAATVAMTKLSNPTVKDSFKKFMRMSGYQGWGEAPGEIAGDLYANAANALIGAEHSFEQFKDIDYWTTNFVGSFLFGGGMHAMAAPSIYADAKVATRLADKRDQTLSKIESKELRDNLKTIGVMDNSLDAATALASLDWGKYRPEDKAYALDYVRENYDLQMHMGIVEASEEMTRLEPRIAEVMGRVHLNDDGSSTGLIYNVVDKTTGKAYYATRGDVTQKDAMLELIDAETGEKTTKIASTIEPVSYHRVDEVIAEEYVNMFSLKNNISRIEAVEDAYESLEDATDEDVASLMDVMSIEVPEVGDTIALIDGRQGVVEEALGGGKYMVTTADAMGDMVTEVVPFTSILSSDAVIANAQKAKVQSEVNRDIDVATTAEVEASTMPTDGIVEGAIVTTPNGEQARVVEITDDGNVVVDFNLENGGVADMTFGQFTLEELQGNAQGAEASTASAAEIVEAAENVESIVADNTKAQEIPRNEDGTVNYEAIEDTTLAAEVFSADYDSLYDAADAISSTIEDINSEIDYLSSKGKGKKRKKTLSLGERKKQDAQVRDLTAKKARYSAMLDAINANIKEMREQEAQQNAEKSKDRSRHPEAGLERNAFTETLSSEMVAAIDAMAKKMGVKVRFTDKKITGNAHYRGNEIVIAQEARDKSILALLGHEVLHHMREYNPNAYEAFKASVREFIGAEKFDAMAKARRAMYARQRVYITAEVAAEEICADMAGEMVMRLDVFEEYLEQNSKKKGLLQSLQNALVYILDFLTGISGFDANYAPKLQTMVDTLNTLINATVEGKDIEKREETSAETTKNEEVKGEDGNTNYSLNVEMEAAASRIADNFGEVDIKRGDVKYALRDVLPETEVEQAVQDLMRVTGRSRGTVERYLKAEQSLAKFILSGDNAAYLDYEADDSVPSIWENSDYPQGTVEFSNICRKRLPLTMIYQKLQKEFPNTKFNKTQLETIRQTLIANGIDVACGLCFVEDRRQHNDEIGQGFIDALSGKDVYVNANQQKAIDKLRESGDNYIPNLYELLTLDGMKKLRMEHPDVANAFVKYNNARGQQAGRLFQAYSAYHREILGFSNARVKKTNDVGGLRIFSFSDFEAHHLIDLVQVLTDCARKGIKVQGYTKVPEFALAVKDTNMKLNRSLIAKDNGVVEADYSPKTGEAVSPNVIDGKRLLLDTVEGIDVNDKNFFDSSASKNVGNILVGINDEQIRIAMLDPFVDYIIPFHTGLSADILKQKGISDWKNYKYEQIEKTIVDGKMVNAKTHVNIYTDVLSDDIKTEKQFVERYLEVCKEKNLVPKFARFLNRDKAGNFVYAKGYYKFLLDFKMFDAKGRILPQEVVQPIFNDEVNKQILDDYVKGEKAKAPNEEVYEEVKEALGLGEKTKFSLASDVASILEEYDTEGVKYGSIIDVADGIEGLISESTEGTTELENILNDFRAAQDDARRWGNRMDSGGEEEFEEALRAYVNKATLGERSDADSHNSSSEGLPLESSERLSGNALTSPKDVAKIGKNTEVTHRSAKNIINEGGLKKEIKTPAQAVSALGKGLHMEKSDSSQSYYGDFFEGDYIVDGNVVHLRISTHPATPVRMGNAEADHKVSIVIRKNGEHKSDGTPHSGYTEYVYEPSEVTPQDAANAVVKGVKSLLETGEFVDETGKAVRRDYPYTDTKGRTMYSLITPEMDASYLDAVERGDMEAAQRMVMEAAKLAMPNTKVVDEDGNPKVVYHQTNHSVYIDRETGQNWDELDWRERMEWDEREDWDEYWEEREFNTFSRVNARTTQELDGFFFAPEYDEYHEYGNRTIKAFLNIENPASFGDYNIDSSKTNAGRDERIRLQNEGYDGVINEEDGSIWEYVAFNPNQIKSADPVNYDDNGNVIPLSERFNPKKEDIRYSLIDPTTDRFNRIVALTKQLASDFNIPCPIFISDTKAEYAEMVKDCLGITSKDAENNAGFYSEEDELIGVNSAILATRGDLRETLLHEYAHHISLKHLTSKIADIVKFIGEDNIREAHQGLLGEAYKYESAETTINEFISFLVEKLTIAKTYAIFAEEMSVDDYISELKDFIASDAEITHKDVLIKVLPLVKDNIELQREQYGKERTSTIVIPRRATQALVSSPQEGSAQTYGNKEGGNRPIEAKPRGQEIDRRGEGTDAQRVSYSLSDIPFFEDEGEVVIFNEGAAPLSDNVVYVAPKTTEERMVELLESQHLARIKSIRKETDDTIAMARKRYAEERVRRADDINNTRSFSAKLDMLFGDMSRETLPLHDQALALIAAGDVKIRWDDDGTKKGLASEMGYKDGEKKNYKQITSKATQSFEGFVHSWWESINGYERGIDVQDMRNALIEALSEASTQSRAFNILREVYDVARKERDTVIDEAYARRDYAIKQEDARYAEERERFDKDPDKASFIRHYEMTRAMDENLDAMTELVSRLDTTIASLKRRVDRAEGKRRADREKDFKKRKQMLSDVYASIEDSKMAIQDTIRKLGAMRYNSNELKWIMNNVHTARSAKDIEVIAERVRNIALTILIREQRTRMNKALNLRLGNGQMLESWLYGLQKDGIISAAEAKRTMNDMWRGTNAKGVAVAKYVDDHTRQVMEKLRAEVMKSAKRSMVDTGAVDSEGKAIKEYGEDKELTMNIEAARNDVNDRIMVFNRSDESTWSDSDKATYSMLFLYMKYLDVIEGKQEVAKARKALNDTFSKINDGGVEGAAAREDIPEKRSALVKAKTTYMDALMSFNEDLESVITKGREGYKTFRENEERHRRDIINLGLNAIGQSNRKSGERLTAKEIINLIFGRGFFNIPYYTFETALREIDHLSPNGQGEFFHHFMDAADAAVGVYASSMLRHVVAIGNKVNDIWGNKNKDVASALLNIQKKANDVVVATFHFKETMDNDGNMLPARVQEVNIANGMYLLAMWGQDRYRRGMEKRGITQEQIDALRGSIEATKDGAKYMQFMEWVRDTFLVDTRDEYDTTHVKMFGTHMDAEQNYFPAKILNYKRDDDFDFDSGKVGELYVTGIIKRTSTAAFINPAVDYFSMLIDHVANMDHWAAYAELHRDLKYLLNSEAFKERLNNYMGGRKGKNEKRDGEGSLYKIFWDTSAVMLDRYKLKATRVDEMIMRMTKGWATANIAGRLSTALKQFASSPLFAVYAFDPRCVREWLRALSNPRAAVKWAMENSAAMRARVDRGDMGNEFLSRKIGGSDVLINEDSKMKAFWKATDELLGKATKAGMAPNVYVDMWSSCIGLKAIYEFEIKRMTEDGKKPITDTIRKKALLRAERAVNETQQSSEGAYLSTIQKQRGVIMSAIATYQNQPYAMHRKRVSGAQELWRQAFDKEYNEALARRVENITDPAERKRELARIRREARRVAYAELAQGILGDFLFQLFGAGMGAICVACAGVDDDEIGLDMLKDALLATTISIGVGGFFLGGLAVSIISGFTKRIGEVPDNLMPAVNGLARDIENVANAIKDEEYMVSLYEALNIISTYGYGIDGETLLNMWRGVDGIIEKSGNTEAVMHILNMPKSQIRLIAGRRREGETVKEYITRVARVEAIGMNDIIDNLIDEEGTLNASALSKSIGGISEKRLKEIAKKADEEYTKDVTNAYLSGGYEAYLRIEDAYKGKVEAIGWTENKNPNNKAYESGEYVAPIAGLSEDEYNSLENIAYEIARYAKERERFMGTEEAYFEYLESEIEAKQQFNEKYNEYIK